MSNLFFHCSLSGQKGSDFAAPTPTLAYTGSCRPDFPLEMDRIMPKKVGGKLLESNGGAGQREPESFT